MTPHAAPEVMDGPVHMVADETAVMPCCGMGETQAPPADRVTMNPALVTCRTAAHDTMPDDRAAHHRPYVPDPAAILAAQAAGRAIAGRLPAVVAFVASLFGYATDIRAGIWEPPPEVAVRSWMVPAAKVPAAVSA